MVSSVRLRLRCIEGGCHVSSCLAAAVAAAQATASLGKRFEDCSCRLPCCSRISYSITRAITASPSSCKISASSTAVHTDEIPRKSDVGSAVATRKSDRVLPTGKEISVARPSSTAAWIRGWMPCRKMTGMFSSYLRTAAWHAGAIHEALDRA